MTPSINCTLTLKFLLGLCSLFFCLPSSAAHITHSPSLCTKDTIIWDFSTCGNNYLWWKDIAKGKIITLGMKLISQPSKGKEKGSHSISTVVSVIVLNCSPRGVESSGMQRWGIQSFFSSGLTILLTTSTILLKFLLLSKVHNWETPCCNKTIRTLILGTHNSMLVSLVWNLNVHNPREGLVEIRRQRKVSLLLERIQVIENGTVLSTVVKFSPGVTLQHESRIFVEN